MAKPTTDFKGLLHTLLEGGVDFIIVGGLACNVHGSARVTFDVDVVYARTAHNIERLVAALAAHGPYLRGAPPGLPFRFDSQTVHSGLNFTLTTALGDLDLLGEVTGGGSYAQLLGDTVDLDLFGFRCRCITLAKLIELKRAAGRVKDLEVIAELEAIAEERGPA